MAGKIFTFVTFHSEFSKKAKDYAAYMINGISELSYNDLDVLKISEIGRTYTQLPLNVIDILLSTQPPTFVATEKTQIIETQIVIPPKVQHIRPLNVIDLLLSTQPPTFVATEKTQIFIPPKVQHIRHVNVANIRNDAQNVHDGELQNAATANLRIIEKNDVTSPDSFEQVKSVFQSHPRFTATEKTHIARVLLSIDDTNVHSKYERTEKQVLDSVWKRINSNINKENRDELIKSLGEQLASGVEHGFVVCSTGKIMRMMGSLEALDAGQELVQLKPKWAIEREIAESASRVRDQVLQECTNEDKILYETGDHPALTKRMREALWNVCVKDYVGPGILKSDEALRLIVDPYLDSF